MIGRWWLALALLLSLGINLGLAASVLLTRRSTARAAGLEAAPLSTPQARGLERLAARLGLEDERRETFVELHRVFFGRLRRAQPRLLGLRRELHREMLAPHPDRERLEALLQEISRTTLDVERGLVELTVRSRELLDDREERLYLQFLSRRLRTVREAVGPAPRKGAPPR